MSKFQIGIVGYGDFTKVMLEYLAPFADILVSSRSSQTGAAGFGASFAPVEDVLSCPIIVPSIPAQFFDLFFSQHRKLVNPEATVIDVSSVKVLPLKALEHHLPNTCQIIGTHPMFGPASIAKNGGIKGLRCVVSSVRASDAVIAELEQFLQSKLKLQVLRRTPEQHDKEMAYVQGLSHYVGRLMDVMEIPNSELSTLAYDDLLDMKNIQGQDSWDLFMSIMHENPFAQDVNGKFKDAIRHLDDKINK